MYMDISSEDFVVSTLDGTRMTCCAGDSGNPIYEPRRKKTGFDEARNYDVGRLARILRVQPDQHLCYSHSGPYTN